MWTAEEVGGDYYDYRQSPSGALTLALGDATGHGLDAGLMVGAAKSLFQSGDDIADLAATLRRLSRGIRSMNLRRMNVAMQLVRLEGRSLRLASAGMPPALIWRAATGEVEEVLIPGPPLGAMPAFPYREMELTWEAGDTLLMMSDGLPETANGAGEDLGYEKVRELFRDLADESLADILEKLHSAGQAFAAGQPQGDDLTLIVIRAKPAVDSGDTHLGVAAGPGPGAGS
ncbi:MAG: SpoIIE family protein phosphatase [Holophagales bacterium]|nr:SpoIIE family protein phosphatase [Holophagales bacterium]